MTMPGEVLCYPGAGLWSTTGHAPPPQPGVIFNVTQQPPLAPAVAQRPISPSTLVEDAKPRTPRSISPPRQVENTKTRLPWTCPCKCKCCGYDLCCPCTCCRCCLWLCVTIFVFILSVGVVVLVFWKVLHPKFPTYNVDNVKFTYRVTGAGATNSPTPSSYVLNTTTLFDMEIGNPNTKIGIYYDQIKLNLQLYGMVIGNQIIPQFYDGYSVTVTIPGIMKSGPVTMSADSEATLAAAETAGNVPLNLKIDVKVRIKIGHFATPQLKVELNCVVDVDPGINSGSQIKGMSCKFSFKL